MPIDVRTITFSEQELREALFGFCRATGRKVPTAGLPPLRIALDGDSSVVAASDGAAASVKFVEHEIAAAAIMYCLKNGIPLPRKAKKSLRPSDDGGISLAFTVGRAGEQSEPARETPGKVASSA